MPLTRYQFRKAGVVDGNLLYLRVTISRYP